jgi:hypothetical protein
MQPTAHLPLLTSYDVPTKTGLDPIHTPTSAPPTTPAYQATHWAQQLLGLNLTVTLHNHFRKRFRPLQSRHSRNHPPPSCTQYTPRGRPFYTTPYTSRLRTMGTHQDL